MGWRDCVAQEDRWHAWLEAVTKQIKEVPKTSQPVKVVILELGAGKNVPTVRCTSERALLDWNKAGADVRLVRVNPELPLGDHPHLQPGGKFEHLVIPVMEWSLACIK